MKTIKHYNMHEEVETRRMKSDRNGMQKRGMRWLVKILLYGVNDDNKSNQTGRYAPNGGIKYIPAE